MERKGKWKERKGKGRWKVRGELRGNGSWKECVGNWKKREDEGRDWEGRLREQGKCTVCTVPCIWQLSPVASPAPTGSASYRCASRCPRRCSSPPSRRGRGGGGGHPGKSRPRPAVPLAGPRARAPRPAPLVCAAAAIPCRGFAHAALSPLTAATAAISLLLVIISKDILFLYSYA